MNKWTRDTIIAAIRPPKWTEWEKANWRGCRMSRRQWFVRRVTERESWWIYMLGGRLTFFKYGFGGRFRWFAIYVTTKRLNVNWRVVGK